MPHAIVKQPNGLYAIWSTIVDDFLTVEATAGQAILEELHDKFYTDYPGGQDALRRDLCREFENIERIGRAWEWAPTWDEAISQIRELHGKEVAKEREDMLYPSTPAPELLEALQSAVDNADFTYCPEVRERCEAVIEKAKGTSCTE